jgi:hypothetical protein
VDRLTDSEKRELRSVTESESLRSDFRKIEKNRHHLLKDANERQDIDRFVRFASEFNAFINHTPKHFRPIKTHVIKM